MLGYISHARFCYENVVVGNVYQTTLKLRVVLIFLFGFFFWFLDGEDDEDYGQRDRFLSFFS